MLNILTIIQMSVNKQYYSYFFIFIFYYRTLKIWNITAFESAVFKLILIYLISHEMLQTLCRVAFKSIAIHSWKIILLKCVSIRLENSKYVHFTEAGVKSERSSHRPSLHFHQCWQKIFEKWSSRPRSAFCSDYCSRRCVHNTTLWGQCFSCVFLIFGAWY